LPLMSIEIDSSFINKVGFAISFEFPKPSLPL